MTAQWRWITFDCFGTLVDWQRGLTGALRPFAGDRTAELVRAYHAHESIVERQTPHRSYKDVLVTALRRAAEQCGVPIPLEATRVLPEAWASMPVFDDVEPMLAELRQRGWKLAVLTNCDEDLFAATQQRFRAPFDLVLTAERVRGYKPAAWHFQGFERLTRLDRRNWVHVANSWYYDIAPARALGIPYVWLDRDRTGETGVPALAHVHTAGDVPQAAGRLVEAVDAAMTVYC